MVPRAFEPVVRSRGDVSECEVPAERPGNRDVGLCEASAHHAAPFKRGLSQCLADVERCALKEVQALTDALAALRAENADLRSRICGGEQTQALDIHHEAVTPAPPAAREEDARIRCHGGLPPHEAGPEGRAQSSGSEGRAESAVHQEVTTYGSNFQSHLSNQRQDRCMSFDSEREARNEVREIIEKSRSRMSAAGTAWRRARTTAWSRERGCAQRLMRSTAFEVVTLAVVLTNAVWIGIDLDYNGKPFLESPPLFQVVESFFIAFFVLEMTVRFMTFPLCRSAVRDPWFVFDAVLVLVMVLESCVLSIVLAVTDHSSIAGLAVGQFSALRILRFLRIARIAKIGRFLPELRTMVAGILMSLRSVLITAVLLVLLTYAFAIFLRELGMSSEWGEQHFGSVVGSCYTLLFASLFPDNVSLMDQIREDSWFCAGLYYIFLLLSSVMIMNLLIGILCDGISRASDAEHDENNVERMCARLREIMTSVDKDFDGLVTKAEFDSILRNEQAVRMLSKVGVDVATMVGQANSIFHGPNQSGLPFDEFKEEVLKYRTSSVATDGSVTATRRLLHYSLEHISGRIDDMYALMLKHGEA